MLGMDVVYDSRKRTMIACVLIVVTVIATLFIYVYPIRSYYAQKHEEKIERERLAVLVKANKKMKEERKLLSTDEKIEEIAREQYRLVKPGEEAYIVSGQETPQGSTP